ncbi:glycine, alanine and asparagine-rich protein-like [Gossypium australe]|uniref:Glycine, alanine and asparagine-rich protein-like n=1 Tax=Gossypium australe TaxID=47621 RepID=A0A5B6V0Y8_9ROSI|nr:glycine, alanine and asparagine-rich protein-like [Gossypium australe]
MKGLGWRIGDGQQVSIWEDSWVPGINMLNGQFRETNPNLVKVAYLIDSNTRKWKTDLIFHTFEEREAKRILSNSLGTYRKFVCALWGIWTARNKFIHEGDMRTGSQIADFVVNYMKELEGIKQILPKNGVHNSRWVAPLGSRVKINFDVAFNRQTKESCTGLIVRNGKAEVICSKAITNKNLPTAFTAEALACYQALELGVQLGLRDVEVEVDSRTVIHKLQEEKVDRSEIAAYIADSKKMIFHFRFEDGRTRRTGNARVKGLMWMIGNAWVKGLMWLKWKKEGEEASPEMGFD